MNNLLQSLSSQRLRVHVSDSELKRLLGAVKEGRGHDNKLADPFYDSLEGVLNDLKTVTIDNHDAEAFLKPVSKQDYPDYHEIITQPMDFSTMLRKIKQKQYRSKEEFELDLELIWENCFTYNTGENHPLRLCAKRLQQKAQKLLKNVTDKRERLEPPVPSDVRPNGVLVNGAGHSRKLSTTPIPKTVIVTRRPTTAPATPSTLPLSPAQKQELTFADSPAFVRTPAGMATFHELDQALAENEAGPSRLPITDKLRAIISSDDSTGEMYGMEFANGDVGNKRKLLVNGDTRPRKRMRTSSKSRSRSLTPDTDPFELWWEACTSSTLMSNALPSLTHSASLEPSTSPKSELKADPYASNRVRKRKKKRPPEPQDSPPTTLLGYINSNIRTLRRVRLTHEKFIALNLSTDESMATGGGPNPSLENIPDIKPINEKELDEGVVVDDRPWKPRASGIELGERNADACLRWMSTKVLEHAGFDSTSKASLDVFAGVASEYLLNVGRTLRYLCDKYSRQMSAEEIILHTLFESGITHVRDLERYITDDVIRYGNRLNELEKKLVNAYNEVASDAVLEEEDAFFNEDEEEEGELLMGNFADAFGIDFLGLKELGITEELGLQSLSIPRKLLRGKYRQRNAQKGTKPSEPPPPYPPPPPFIQLESSRVESQIGLLKPFYMSRFNSYVSRSSPSQPPPFIPPPPRPLSPTTALQLELEGSLGTGLGDGTINPSIPTTLAQQQPSMRNPDASLVILPDDTPPVARTKSGPLGQILRPSASSGKKKSKPKDPSTLPSVGLSGSMGSEPTVNGVNGATVGTPVPEEVGTMNGIDMKKNTIASPKKKSGSSNGPDPPIPMPPVMPIMPVA